MKLDGETVSGLNKKGMKPTPKKGPGISDLGTTIPDNRARGISPSPSDKGSFGTGRE